MIRTTLVVGAPAGEREAAIAAVLDPQIPTAVVLEGLADGAAFFHPDNLVNFPLVNAVRISPGCLCCDGGLTMRVTLNRVVRQSPFQLYISLATIAHLARIREFLTQPPYDGLLRLTEDLPVS